MEDKHNAPPAYQPIGNYGIIGNLSTVALVSMTGSIDFMCFTRFDSPSLFAALLDAEKGGSFAIEPQSEGSEFKQLYLPDTTVLLTRFLSENGVAELTDFMPVKTTEENCVLVRSVVTTRGNVAFRMRCQPRFDYARTEHRVEGDQHEVWFTSLKDPKSGFRLLSNATCDRGERRVCYVFAGRKRTGAFCDRSLVGRGKTPRCRCVASLYHRSV